MKRHYAICSSDELLVRWKKAFPGGVRCSRDLPHGAAEREGVVLWLHQEQMHPAALATEVSRLRALAPNLPLVVMSLDPRQIDALHAFDAGAVGYCHALAVPELMEQVAVVVDNGGLWLGPELMRRMIGSVAAAFDRRAGSTPGSVLDALSPRERAVVLEVAKGAANKEIARTLAITARTVKAHLGSAFAKLGVRDRLQLVLMLKSEPGVLESTA